MSAGLRVLVVDDEQPAVDEMTWLLQRDDRVGEVLSCTSATEALRLLLDERRRGDFVPMDEGRGQTRDMLAQKRADLGL